MSFSEEEGCALLRFPCLGAMYGYTPFLMMHETVAQDYDDIPIRRSYEREVMQPMKGVKGGTVTELRRLRYGSHNYPLFSVQYPALFDPTHPSVLLLGGVHGDEPAGVHAIIDFLGEEVRQYADRLNVCLLPCVNPSGFEADARFSMNGVDLNRAFGMQSAQPEIRAIEEWLAYRAHRFLLTLDLHENNPEAPDEDLDGEENPRACYLYEWTNDRERRIGRHLIEALPYGAPVCLLPTIEKDTNDRGVIAYPEACHNPKFVEGPLDAYLVKHWTDHAVTTETPAIWSMERRIDVQRLWLRCALDLVLLERKV